MNTWVRTREVANWLNLSTISGMALAFAARCPVVRGERGILLARNYTPALPRAGAFTVGNVVFFRAPPHGPKPDPRLLAHEEAHSTQYALCLGLPFLPLYFAAAGYSWLRTSDPASRNIFERAAGLQAGGYREVPVRKLAPVLAAQLRRVLRTGPETPPAASTGGTTA
ncbi:hypothetical protein GCM10009715_20710 [Paeniglutamicibacter psychrophenolicus]|uniref:eCIS core domain-containing protein n=1 Tax=Paeniglutamicibacter psychrophenolicus TaxID=257454 RepID=A0ABS4WH23_9MICC|nr:DUF4157 domain-containing protein [Paeniglutamicibacter psychrophenolicus]MBP2375510.1 hypothetical protein [Paeniglutamicibacter psychrophenolicus]